nr:pathogenicity determinant protein C del2 [synthetic construct]
MQKIKSIRNTILIFYIFIILQNLWMI